MQSSTKNLIQGLIFTTIGSMLLLDRFGIHMWQHVITLLYIGIILYGLILISRALK